MTRKENNNKPVKVFRLHGISAKVFENQTEQNTSFCKVLIERTYRDGKDWKSTSAFGRDDLPLVSIVATQAFEYIEGRVLDQPAQSQADED